MTRTKSQLTFVLFQLLIIISFYLYSLRSYLIPWNAADQDGLYFLFYFLFILPSMIILSLNNFSQTKLSLSYRCSYFLYFGIISLPAIISLSEQYIINAALIICIITYILSAISFFKTNRGNVKSPISFVLLQIFIAVTFVYCLQVW